MNWYQIDNKVFVESIEGTFQFLMPTDFKLEEVDKSLISLAEIVLFSPWYDELKDIKLDRKAKGDKIALMFSGGADSMAAKALLPKDKTILCYHKRIGGDKMMKQDNPLFVFKKNNLDVKIIESDHENIRTHYQLMNGFSTDFAHMAPFILLADKWGIKYMSTGMMFESTYIQKGYKYREFGETDYWKFWSKIFKDCGLELFFPVIPCSEILNVKIIEDNKLFSISCIRGLGKPCENCYKCFRKSCLRGFKPEMNPETYRVLNHKPIKQGASLIYASNKYNLKIAELDEYRTIDVSWLSGFYEPGVKLVPKEYQEYLFNELSKYAKPITQDISNFELK